jgi:hypothetical protein
MLDLVIQALDKFQLGPIIRTHYMIFTRRLFLKVIGLVLFVLIVVFSTQKSLRNNQVKTKQFYSTNVAGKLVSITGTTGGFVEINLDNGGEFSFCPSGNDVKFKDFAKIGDLIFKPAFSDTLVVVKDRNKYFFFFLRP